MANVAESSEMLDAEAANDANSFPPYRRLRLHNPSLQAVADCLQRACRAAFSEADVDIVDCPDLSAPLPGAAGVNFKLASKGICGSPTLVHAGGVPYLLPTPQAEKRRYDIRSLLAFAECPDGLAIGAGAAASAKFGKNAEFVANLGALGNGCRVASVANDNDRESGLSNCRLDATDFAEINLLGDLFCSRGETGGPVLRLTARSWIPDGDGEGGDGERWWRVGHFTEMLQRALGREFSGQDLPVGLGGVFRLSGAPAHMHVMPDFSSAPLHTADQVNRWLHFVDMPDPLVNCGTLISHDPREWGLRLEHFHGWNPDTEACGGHYHHDVAPDSAQYLAYFSLAGALVRVDPPGGLESCRDE